MNAAEILSVRVPPSKATAYIQKVGAGDMRGALAVARDVGFEFFESVERRWFVYCGPVMSPEHLEAGVWHGRWVCWPSGEESLPAAMRKLAHDLSLIVGLREACLQAGKEAGDDRAP